MNDKYISPSKITKQFNITSGTLRKWGEEGKLRFIRPNSTGRRIYNVTDVEKLLGVESTMKNKKTICYARVNSESQRDELEKQIKCLKKTNPDSCIITDIDLGINWKRPGFQSMLDLIYEGKVDKIVVTYKDRLCSFGIEILEWLLKKNDIKLQVLSPKQTTNSFKKELAEDLFEITSIFVSRKNGLTTNYNKHKEVEDDVILENVDDNEYDVI